MKPAARIQAAIEVLDAIASGLSAEKALTGWARAHRFAGAKDRRAIRDHVFDALRRRRSYAALGGSGTGRGLMLGATRATGADPTIVFSGATYAPAKLGPEDGPIRRAVDGSAEALDCPDWLFPLFQASLGADCAAVLASLRDRAPVHLRVNLRKASRGAALERLAGEGIPSRPHPLSPSALEVTAPHPNLNRSAAYQEGWIELQDAGSQAAADRIALLRGGRFLDYCAGAGGKTLAVAARCDGRFFAHDAVPARMRDLPGRAARAGVLVETLATAKLDAAAPFDTVLVDAPCSGSGSWRRDPQGKWHLTPDRLAMLTETQDRILADSARLLGPQGRLCYLTCSLLGCENGDRVAAFLARFPGWSCLQRHQFTPLDGGDGFFFAELTSGKR